MPFNSTTFWQLFRLLSRRSSVQCVGSFREIKLYLKNRFPISKTLKMRQVLKGVPRTAVVLRVQFGVLLRGALEHVEKNMLRCCASNLQPSL